MYVYFVFFFFFSYQQVEDITFDKYMHLSV